MFFNEELFQKNNKIKLEILKLEEIIKKLKEAKKYFERKDLNIEEKNLYNKVEVAYDYHMFKLFKIIKHNKISKEKISIKLEKENINDWFDVSKIEDTIKENENPHFININKKKKSILKEYFD